MPDIEYINPRSEEIQDIMEQTPGWMMRWGITFFFVFVLLVLGISWFIKYPDVINTNIVITSVNPPIKLLAQSSGKLQRLMVKDKQHVDSNTILALIENSADYNDVLALEKCISDSTFLKKPFPVYQLGELEGDYSVFKQASEEYISYKTIAINKHKIKAIEQQESNQQLLYNRNVEQFHTLTEEYQLSIVKYRADSELYAKGAIAKFDLNNSCNVLLEKKYVWQGANSTLAQTQIQINELNVSLTELQLQDKEDQEKYVIALSKSLEQLKAAIKLWEQRYVISSPITGRVSLFNYWAVNMPVKQGDILMIVTPERTGTIIGRINLSAYGSAKVKEGQVVNIKLTNYMYEDYGVLPGVISSISLLPKDSLYAVKVVFPEGMKSSYNKPLEFMQEMTGTAEIITDKKRLINRLFNKLKI